jgi:hypothetical protein
MPTQTIYENGRFRVTPLVTRLLIEVDGKVVQTLDPWDVERAVAEVDRMAEGDGQFVHASC